MNVILFITLIVILITIILVFIPSYLTHISMNKGDNPKIIRMTTFKRFILKVNSFIYWEKQDRCPKSLFANDEYYKKWYVHADIIRLDGEHFIFWPHSFIAFKVWELRLGKKKKSYKFYWR